MGTSVSTAYTYTSSTGTEVASTSSSSTTTSSTTTDSSSSSIITYDSTTGGFTLSLGSITVSYLAEGINATDIGFNAAKVGGRSVSDTGSDSSSLWTAAQIISYIAEQLNEIVDESGGLTVSESALEGLSPTFNKVHANEMYMDGSRVLTAASDVATATALTEHTTDSGNPHAVTASQVCLGEVDNTADSDKPVSTAQQAALDLKLSITNLEDSLTSTSTSTALTANQGVVLKGLIEDLTTLVSSDDTNLDTVQEIVEYIKLNKEDLESLTIAAIIGLQDALDLKADQETTYTQTEVDTLIAGVEDTIASSESVSSEDVVAMVIALG